MKTIQKAIDHRIHKMEIVMKKYKTDTSQESSSGGVSESFVPARNPDKNVDAILSDIVARLERIEEKIDENVYPPESAIRPEFVKQVRKARADIKKGKGTSYNSADDFFREIEA